MMGSVFLWYKLVPNGQGMIIARYLWHGIYDAVSMIDHDLSLPFDRYVLFFQMQIVGNLWIDKWAASRQIQQNDRCAQQSLRSAGALAMSDQFSLSTWRKLGSSAQQRLWSDWAHAQADLSFRWAHMPFSWFCHEAAHLWMKKTWVQRTAKTPAERPKNDNCPLFMTRHLRRWINDWSWFVSPIWRHLRRCINDWSWFVSPIWPLCPFFQMQIVGNLWIDKWAASRQNQQNNRCAQRRRRSAGAFAQSDQSSLSTWRKLGSSAQQRLWSDWAHAQADLSFRWAHMPFSWFCHEAAHLWMDKSNWYRKFE